MKKFFITILWIFILQNTIAQHLTNNRYVWTDGEYNTFVIDKQTHRLYQVNNFASSFVSAGLPDSFATGYGGAHWAIFLTVGGNVWTWGDSSISTPIPARVMTDSLGNPFSNVVKVMSGGTAGAEPWNFAALKADGTVWIWKYTNIGLKGNGTNNLSSYSSLPVQVPFPGGTVIKDIAISFCGVALDNAGHVWTWGANPTTNDYFAPYLLGQNCGACAQPYNWANTPTQITLPTTCKMISGGSSLSNWFLLTDGTIYATSFDIGYIGLQKYSGHQDMSYNNFLAIRVDTALHLPQPVDTMVQTSNGEFFQLTDTSEYFIGSNACGQVGMGPGLDMRHYNGSNGYTPYSFDQGHDQAMTGSGINGQALPVQIMPGIKITQTFGSSNVNYYTHFLTVHDSSIVTGRNKYGVAGNNKGYLDDSTAEQSGNFYPNGLDINYAYIVTLFPIVPVVRMPNCRLCVDSPTANYCSTHPIPSGTNPIPSVTIGKWSGHYTVQGSPGIQSGAAGENQVIWTPDANCQMPLRANDTVALYNPTVGRHPIQYYIEDNNYRSATVSKDVYVGWSRRRIGYHHFR